MDDMSTADSKSTASPPASDETLDGLLRRAALRAPERTAIIDATGARTSFAALDAAASRYAVALRHHFHVRGQAVAVVGELTPAFAAAYYGISRSGNVIVLVNAVLSREALRHVLATSGAVVTFTSAGLAEPIAALRHELPALREVVVLDGALLPDRLAGITAEGQENAGGPTWDAADMACIQFTSGTTGEPKGVRLSHRNLVVNASQIAAAHGLGEASVALNNLPTYHPMHLNSAVYATATQVLYPAEDPVGAVAAANRYGATHFYSLPVRLARMAADPRLPGLRLETVSAVFSGGSALDPAAAAVLSEHWGVPVVQGYGLAETSPLTHCDRPERPRPGSVGQVVAGTECRIVDVRSRVELPAGELGEVQVRGPQVMRGYLGQPESAHLDDEGWFSTGDLGYQDEEGYLFLVDRLKDVFKCDNWLVAPSEIERVLLSHPRVVDCAVADVPVPFSGAVAYGEVVLAEDDDGDLAELMDFVNGQVPYYQRLHGLQRTERIPRSGNGKILRRVVRHRLRERFGQASPSPGRAPAAEGVTR